MRAGGRHPAFFTATGVGTWRRRRLVAYDAEGNAWCLAGQGGGEFDTAEGPRSS
jgi:hypothetical protein